MPFQIVSSAFKKLATVISGICWNIDSASYESKSLLFGIDEITNEDIEFDSTGTEMYVLGSTLGLVFQYTLSTPWDTSTATATQSFSVVSEDTDPQGLEFGNSGTRMYVSGTTSDTIYQYNLSVAWDISTAVLNTGSPSSLYVGTQDTDPTGLTLSTDGSRLYVMGTVNDFVYQYNLSVPWELSSAVYEFSRVINPTASTPVDVVFKSDGLRMYILSGNIVSHYVLSTAWEVATAVFDVTEGDLNVDRGANTLTGMFIKSDGLQMFAINTGEPAQVREYTFSTAWEIDTAKPLTDVRKFESSSDSPENIFVSPDGTKLYATHTSNDVINQYTLVTPWDILTAEFEAITYVVEAQDSWTLSGVLSEDGTKLFNAGRERAAIHQHSLTTPWDISTASYDQVSVVTGTGTTSLETIAMSSDGTSIYVAGGGLDKITQISLSTPYDITTAELGSVVDTLPSHSTSNYDIAFSSDGTQMYEIGASTVLYQRTLSVPWKISTAQYFGNFFNVSTEANTPTGFTFSTDGTRMFVLDSGGDDISQYNLGTAWDLSSSVYSGLLLSITGEDFSADGLSASDDGTKLYVSADGDVFQYTLPGAWDLTGASYSGNQAVMDAATGSVFDVIFTNSGATMTALGRFNSGLYRYTLSTAWDVSTATYDSVFTTISFHDRPSGLAFSDDGLKMYVGGEESADLFEYDLSVPWDLTSAAYNGVFISVSPGTNCYGITFRPNGLIMYVLTGFSDSIVYQFTLTVPWDLSTATYASLSFAVWNDGLSGIAIDPTGTKLLATENTTFSPRFYQYPLSTPWDISTATVPSNLGVALASSPKHISFNPDGLRLISMTPPNLYQHSSSGGSPGWDISTFSYDSIFKSLSAQDTAPKDFVIDPTGTILIMLGDTDETAHQYEMTVPWDLSTLIYPGEVVSESWAARETVPRDIAWNPNGLSLFVVGSASDEFNHFTVSPAWDLGGTVTWQSVKDITTPASSPLGLFFKSDGTKVYCTDSDDDRVYQWTLPTPYVLSGITLDAASFFIGTATPHAQTTPTGLSFSSDGMNMYVSCISTDKIVQYPLATAWDLSTAGFGSPTASYEFSVSPPESSPYGHAFSTDGTKLFVVGTSLDTVYKFDLTIAWDLSTAQPYDDTFYIGDIIGSAYGLSFKPDGTKMFITASTDDATFVWDLAIAWDITSAISPDTYTFFEGQDLIALDISTDGTKMFMMESQIDSVIYQYTMSTPWLVSTASYDNASALISSFSPVPPALYASNVSFTPNGMTFGNSGTTLYLTATQFAVQYTLTTPYDITSLEYAGIIYPGEGGVSIWDIEFHPDGDQAFLVKSADGLGRHVLELTIGTPWELTGTTIGQESKPMAPQGTEPRNAIFSADGSIMYVLTDFGSGILQFNLSTPWDITSKSVGSPIDTMGLFFKVAQEDYESHGIFFNDTGTKMYLGGYTSGNIFQYTLSTAWQVSTATFDDVMIYIGNEDLVMEDIAFSADGMNMYMVGSDNDYLWQYNLSVAWDLSTAVVRSGGFGSALDVGNVEFNTRGISFSTDGSVMFLIGDDDQTVYEFAFTTPWDVTTGTYTGVAVEVFPPETTPSGIRLSSDGTKMFMTGNTTGAVFLYNLSTPNKLSSATYSGTTFVTTLQDSSPEAVAISSDGTKMYMAGQDGIGVYQYTLSTPFDVSTGSYDNVFLGTTAQDFVIQDITFNPTGTQMFMTGGNTDAVYRYALSSAWDLLTATYDNSSFNMWIGTSTLGAKFSADGTDLYIVSGNVKQYTLITPWDINSIGFSNVTLDVVAGGTSPQDVAFDSTGTKMYVIDINFDQVSQWTLSTPWDISSGTFDNKTLKIGDAIATNPQGVAFKTDGSVMYIMDSLDDDVTQYNLLTPYDVSTAVFNEGFDVSDQDLGGSGVAFKTDGTKMYIVGSGTDSVYEYTLGTAWDVTTAAIGSPVISFSVANEDLTPTGLFFKSDGTKLYIVGGSNDSIFEYDLSIAWDLSTTVAGSPSAVTLSVTAQDTAPNGMSFSSDGTKMYMVGSTNDTVHEYVVSNPWDITSAALGSPPISFAIGASTITDSTGIAFKPDGTMMFFCDFDTDRVYGATLSTPWDVTTAGPTSSFYVNPQSSIPQGVAFKSDGTKMYVCGSSSDDVFQYTLNTPWDVSSAVYDSVNFPVTQDTTVNDVTFNPTGSLMIVTGSTNDKLYEYVLSTPWDLSTAALGSPAAELIVGRSIDPTDLIFGDSGTKMYVMDDFWNEVLQYTLSTPYDLSTASYSSINFTVALSSPEGLAFKSDGTKMYILDSSSDFVYEYDLGTAWDVSSSVYNSVSFDVNLPEGTPTGIDFSPDGMLMYMVGSSTDFAYQYPLLVAWDLSSVQPYDASFDISPPESTPRGVRFRSDGSTMYMLGSSVDTVYQYTLLTPWDLTTIQAYNGSFYVGGQTSSTPEGLDFNATGTKMYVVSSTNDFAFEYDLGTAWDVTTAVYNNISFNTQTAPLLTPTGAAFKSDGLEIYVVGATADRVHRWTLSVAYDISTATDTGDFISVQSQDTTPESVDFSSDGTKMYIVGNVNYRIFQYKLSVAWDITTATYVGENYNIRLQDLTPTDVRFNSNGLQMFVTGDTNNTVYQYTLSVAWDLSTATYDNISFGTTLFDTSPSGIDVSPDGAHLYVIGYSNDKVHEFTMGTPLDLDTATHTTSFLQSQEGTPRGVVFSNDGTKMYISGSGNDTIYEYNLGTAWDVSTAVYNTINLDVSLIIGATDIYGVDFSADGTKMIVNEISDVHAFTLSTPFDLSTATYDNVVIDFGTLTANSHTLSVDGTKLIMLSERDKKVFQYTLSTPWDLTGTVTYQSFLDVSGDESNPQGCRMCENGAKLFITGGGSPSTVRQYTLGTPWNLTTATLDGTSLDIEAQDADPTGLVFLDDGSKLYVTGDANNRVYQYTNP